jgi:hypothetical protein
MREAKGEAKGETAGKPKGRDPVVDWTFVERKICLFILRHWSQWTGEGDDMKAFNIVTTASLLLAACSLTTACASWQGAQDSTQQRDPASKATAASGTTDAADDLPTSMKHMLTMGHGPGMLK